MGRFNGIPPQQKLDGVPHFHILSLSPLVLAVVELHILNEFLLGFQLQVLVEGLNVLFLKLFDERDDFLHVLGGVPDGVGEFLSDEVVVKVCSLLGDCSVDEVLLKLVDLLCSSWKVVLRHCDQVVQENRVHWNSKPTG